jgi:hypothetical protein
MIYYNYWSILETPTETINSELIILTIGLLLLIFSFVIFKYKTKIKLDDKIAIGWVSLIVGILFIGLFAYNYIYPTATKNSLLELKDRNLTSFVEGRIANFKTEYQNTRAGLRTIESFKVDSISFNYNDYPLNEFNNFSKTHKNGGILKNGQQTRITYIKENNRIVKIELLREK